jgi:hypothetical protein
MAKLLKSIGSMPSRMLLTRSRLGTIHSFLPTASSDSGSAWCHRTSHFP